MYLERGQKNSPIIYKTMNKSKISQNAQKYLAKGQIDKAIQEWELLLKENEFDGNLHNTIGDLYLRLKKYDKAVEFFKKAASIFRQDGFAQKAKGLYNKIVNVKPEDVDSIVVLAELDEDKGLVVNAVNYYLKAVQICLKKGDKDRGLGLIKKVSALAPDNLVLRGRIADVYIAIGLKKQGSDEYCRLGAKLESKNDINKARFFYTKAIETEENNFQALVGLSRVEQLSGNMNTAFQYCQKAVAIEPNNSNVLLKYAELSLKINHINDAIESVERVAQLEPGNMKVRRLLGIVYLKHGKVDRAWKELLPFIDEELNRQNWQEAYDLLQHFKTHDPIEVGKRLFKVHKNMGNIQAAIDELRSIAELYEKDNQFRDALQVYRELAVLDPSKPVYREKEGILKKQLADTLEIEEEAVSALKPVSGKKTLAKIFKEIDILISYELYSDAIRLLELLKEKCPTDPEVQKRLQTIYKFQAGSQHQPADAGDTFEEDLYEADFYAQQGLFEEAIEIYEKLLSRDPDNKAIKNKLEALKSGEFVPSEFEESTDDEISLELELEEKPVVPKKY
jgi:tetratricopeptide (TPR) repeat protein